MSDTYSSFRELERRHSEGSDWLREYVDRGSGTLVMAPHGGWIEPFTAELAQAVAGDRFSFYAFHGLMDSGCAHLHLTSHRFDEPLALSAASSARWILAIHGERTARRKFVMVGGLWEGFRRRMIPAFQEMGIPVEGPRKGLGGVHPHNICNRSRTGRGAQLEVSEGLRRVLREDPEELHRFVEAVQNVLEDLEADAKEASHGR